MIQKIQNIFGSHMYLSDKKPKEIHRDNKSCTEGKGFVIDKAEATENGFQPGIVYCFNSRMKGTLCKRCLQKDICEDSIVK